MEEFVVSSNNHHHDHQSRVVMLKRKRTQRQRPLSLLDTVTTTSSSSGGGGTDVIGDETVYESTTTTEEDEDMANCLILLAHSGDNNCDGLISENHRHKSIDVGNFTNGIYCYECRTCNRTFNSFQALGGHRASHKKPKNVLSEEKKTIDHPLQQDHHQQQQHVHNQNQNQNRNRNQTQNDIKKIKNSNNTTTNVTLPLLHGTNLFNKTSSKIHECSICGAEFSSGQALGGHMRRHRTLTTSQIITGDKKHEPDKKQQNILSLDLNLPAPPEDDDDDRNECIFHVFPPPTLINCHY